MPDYGVAKEVYRHDGYRQESILAYNRLCELCARYEARVRELEAAMAAAQQTEDALRRDVSVKENAARTEILRLRAVCGQYEARILELEAATARQRMGMKQREAEAKTKEIAEKKKTAEKGRKAGMFDILFYAGLAIALVVLFAFFSGGGGGAPRSFMGFSAMRVLTESMQDEIPKDSLIVTREVDPSGLAVGDDITFLINADTTVTHRIVKIYEDYANTGMPGFQTQGIMNSNPDREIVSAQNVVGKVVFHNLALGKVFGFVGKYALWIGMFAALGIGMFAALRVAFSRETGRVVREEL